jgi:hypothetical protein
MIYLKGVDINIRALAFFSLAFSASVEKTQIEYFTRQIEA